MIIVNRCTLQTSKSAIRGSVKAVNPRAQIVYESEDDAFYGFDSGDTGTVAGRLIKIHQLLFRLPCRLHKDKSAAKHRKGIKDGNAHS